MIKPLPRFAEKIEGKQQNFSVIPVHDVTVYRRHHLVIAVPFAHSKLQRPAERKIPERKFHFVFITAKGGRLCNAQIFKAVNTGVQISNMSVSKNLLKFRWDRNLSAWPDAGTMEIACVFLRKSDDTWVGGKIDWISSGHTERDFGHIHGGYNGWSLNGVPNPCELAFVVVHGKGDKRSNVLRGMWTR